MTINIQCARLKVYWPCVYQLNTSAQSDYLLSVGPFYFEHELEAKRFATKRGIPRRFVQTSSIKVFISHDGTAVTDLGEFAKKKPKSLKVFHDAMPREKREQMLKDYDKKTSRARRIAEKALALELSEEKAIAFIKRELKKAKIYPECWEELTDRQPTRKDLAAQLHSLQIMDKFAAEHAGRQYIARQYSSEELRKSYLSSLESAHDVRQESALSVQYWDGANGVPRAKAASIGFGWGEDCVLVVAPLKKRVH